MDFQERFINYYIPDLCNKTQASKGEKVIRPQYL